MGPTTSPGICPLAALRPAGPSFPKSCRPCWTLGGGTRAASRGPAVGPSRAAPSQQALLLGGARTRGRLVTHPLRMARSVPAVVPADSLSAALALPSRLQPPSRGLCRAGCTACAGATAGTGWAGAQAHALQLRACLPGWPRGARGRAGPAQRPSLLGARRGPAGPEPAGAAVRAAPWLEPHGGLDPDSRAPSQTLPPCPGFPACAARVPLPPTSCRSVWEPQCTARPPGCGCCPQRVGSGVGVGGSPVRAGRALQAQPAA